MHPMESCHRGNWELVKEVKIPWRNHFLPAILASDAWAIVARVEDGERRGQEEKKGGVYGDAEKKGGRAQGVLAPYGTKGWGIGEFRIGERVEGATLLSV